MSALVGLVSVLSSGRSLGGLSGAVLLYGGRLAVRVVGQDGGEGQQAGAGGDGRQGGRGETQGQRGHGQRQALELGQVLNLQLLLENRKDGLHEFQENGQYQNKN